MASLLTVSHLTVRRSRAERHEEARQGLKKAVSPLREELIRYRNQTKRTSTKRGDDYSHLEDHERLVAVRTAAADLPAWRRRLIDRRCRRVFGDYWTNLARRYPSEHGGGKGSFVSLLSASSGDNGEDDSRESLIHRTFASPPTSPLGAQLDRQLRLLAAGR